MGHKPGVTQESAVEQERRDQEVLRANRELAAYFKGRRTEREARAALKIIKAFVRDRERRDARSRPPLPGADAVTPTKKITNRHAASESGERHRRKARRKLQDTVTKPEPPQSSESDEQTPE
jgi:hypothetical protein